MATETKLPEKPDWPRFARFVADLGLIITGIIALMGALIGLSTNGSYQYIGTGLCLLAAVAAFGMLATVGARR